MSIIKIDRPKVGDQFMDLFSLLVKKDDGPGLISGEALRLARAVLINGPSAKENFDSAYTFGTSKKGLALSQVDAVAFARKMASYSEPEKKVVPPAEPAADKKNPVTDEQGSGVEVKSEQQSTE